MSRRDNIVPIARGGTDDAENLAVCCKPCNSGKCARTLHEFRHSLAQRVLGMPSFTRAQIDWMRAAGADLSAYDNFQFWFEKVAQKPAQSVPAPKKRSRKIKGLIGAKAFSDSVNLGSNPSPPATRNPCGTGTSAHVTQAAEAAASDIQQRTDPGTVEHPFCMRADAQSRSTAGQPASFVLTDGDGR